MTTIEILLELKGDIAHIKQRVREVTGSYKYDDCYDDCLRLIDKKIFKLENEN